ncbi:hypothetical protein, partial [Shewanella sairae]|uniref:hypothetical protein n=1 Tax=Shewanella sairae TaxID=190310 RepID=UPI001C7EBE8B
FRHKKTSFRWPTYHIVLLIKELVAGAELLFIKAWQRPSPIFYKKLSPTSYQTAPSPAHETQMTRAPNFRHKKTSFRWPTYHIVLLIKELVAGAELLFIKAWQRPSPIFY